MTQAITVDLHIHARLAKFGDIERHTHIEMARRIAQILEELGNEHQFLTTIPIVEIIGRDG